MPNSIYGKKQEAKELWVFLEHEGGRLAKVSRELLGRAAGLGDEAGWPAVGVLLGQDVEGLGEQAVTYGADKVVIVEHPALSKFEVGLFTAAMEQIVRKEKPSVLLLGATPDGRDLAGRLAVRLRTGLNADCTQLRLNKKQKLVTSEVTGFGGGVVALLESPDHRPQMSTVRPGVFPVPTSDPSRKGEVVRLNVELSDEQRLWSLIDESKGEGVDLTLADYLICGGRGMDGDFQSLYGLAELLGGMVGATRPPVDDGHIERERQVGQTGVVCRPKIAFNFGISGAFHYVVGIQEADVVVSVNIDPEAPIFEYSDYCITGDVHEIIPALMRVFSNLKDTDHA
jgi:electron transfer flavoprotein alpha subunit